MENQNVVSENIYIDCVDCKKQFYFKPSDQARFAKLGLVQPKRCWDCRQKRRNEREGTGQSQEVPYIRPQPSFRKAWQEAQPVTYEDVWRDNEPNGNSRAPIPPRPRRAV